ncbi:hypothetical protein EBZ80_20955, partial [bacterium]|nr:hypothetical protein [bacterium]
QTLAPTNDVTRMSGSQPSLTAEERQSLILQFPELPRGIEPFASAFRRTAEGISSPDKEVRAAARREWMTFMRAHIHDFLCEFPELIPEFVEMMKIIADNPRHSLAYREDAAYLLRVATWYH